VPEAATLTATDNCDVAPVVTYKEVRTDGVCPSTYTLTRTWTATDACSNSASKTQVIKVQDTTAPVLSEAPADATVECNAVPVAATLTATDNCDAAPVVTYKEVSTDGACPSNYTLTRIWTATDACSNSSSKTQVITVQDKKAPVLSEAPTDITVESNAVPTAATLTATDNCDAAPVVTYTEVRTDGNCPNNYTLTRTWTATDACGNSSSKTQIIKVQDTAAPVLSDAPADVTVECNVIPDAATLTASDYNSTVIPVTYTEVRTNGVCPSTYTLTRTWTATDACGNSSSKVQVIKVQDTTAPILSEAPADVTVECNAVPVAATLTATDNCDVAPVVTYSEVRTDGVCPSTYTLTRTWTATDACGNSASKVQVIKVQDTTAPILSEAPADVTVECNAVPEAATLTATDNCDVAPVVTYKEVRTDGVCPSTYSLTRTWTATDACGNSASKTQVIKVQDTKAPILSEAPADVTVECNAVPVAATLTATDNCDAAPVVTYKEVRTDGVCPSTYTLTRTWTATDACNNSASKTQVIKVQDTTAPVLSCPPSQTVFVDVDKNFATVTIASPTVTDNCGQVKYSNDFNHTMNASGQYPIGTTTVTWTATDECGNTTSCKQTITVVDNQNPLFTKCFTGQNVSFTSQSGVYTYTIKGTGWDATATDNDALASLTYDMTGATTGSGTTLDNAILNVGLTNIKWTATDKSGNTTVCEYAITVIYGNVPPIAVDDNVSTPEDITATGNVLANDTDPDVTNVLTVTGFVWNGTTYSPGTATSAEGTLTLNANGGFTFVPTLNYNGTVPAITYMISDGVGGTASAKLIITVTAVNDAPVARPDVYTTPEDTPVSGNVLANDSDVDGDPLSVANIVVGEKVYTTPASVNVSSTGTLVAAANGAFTFTPALNFNGKVPTVFYRATDGSAVVSSTLDITVTAANDNPVANADVKSTPEDTPLNDNVLTNDADVDGDPLTVTGFTIGGTAYSAGATATMTGIGTIIINTNGSYTFTPMANYNGSVPVITYNISDGNGGTASGTLTITVTSVSDPPVAVNDNVTMIQNTSTTINVLSNDSFGPDGPSTTAITATSAAHGTVTVNNGGTPNNPTDDKIVYTPTTGYTGSDSFTYTIAASNGLTSTATVTITVRPYTDMMTFNKRSTSPVNNGDGTVNWKYTISVTNKLTTDSITSIHITDDLSRVILSPMEFRVVGITATGKLKANGLFDGVTRTNVLLDGSAVAPNSTEEITIEVHTTLNRFFGTVYNQAVLDGSSRTTGAISNVLSDDPSNTEGAFPRPTKTEIPEILIIPDAFTPNQDGHNDKFTIIHSSRITISLEVFNRWGNKVYESNDYQNDWDGKGSGHLLGQNLPSGTYYYIIVIRNTETNKVEKLASYITLRR
ncbi:Ig-like domain-containing protein, partial [Paludibacter jiangxiensis]